MRRVWQVSSMASAIVCGVALASFTQLRTGSSPDGGSVATGKALEESRMESPLTGSAAAPIAPRQLGSTRPSVQPDVARSDHDVPVNASFGLLTARTANGVFLGYRVTGVSTDPRFRTGDLITGIAGRNVEDSAAGSEILIAAIMDPAMSLRVAERFD